jgi:hypothetical protein
MPNLAGEIKSPDEAYLSLCGQTEYDVPHGSTMVWLSSPEKRLVEVYQPGKDIDSLVAGGTRSGGDVLPGHARAPPDAQRTKRVD